MENKLIIKLSVGLSIFVIAFVSSFMLENAGNTYAADTTICPDGYQYSSSETNIGNSSTYGKCVREYSGGESCKDNEMKYSYENKNGNGTGGYCYVLPIKTFSQNKKY